jgi:hypothetical protein
MSETPATPGKDVEPSELADRLRVLRGRLGELRGRL